MEYMEIPYVDRKVSRIFYGTAISPFMEGGDGNDLLDAVFSMGINTFDTARAYGKAEKSLGKWIAERGNRKEIVILSKCAHPDLILRRKRVSEKEIRKDFEKSTAYLNTDFIDIYLLHRDDPDVEAGQVVEILNAMYAEGKIGAFGGSNWTHQRIAEANEYAYKRNLIPFSVSSPNFGLAEQVRDPWGGGCVTISGPSQAEARAWYQKTGMPVIAYSSLGHGLFSGRVKSSEPEKAGEVMDAPAVKGYGCPDNFERLRRCEELAEEKQCSVPQIAMAWIYHQNINAAAVVSSSKAERMRQNIEAMYMKLSEEEAQYLNLEADCRSHFG